MKKQISLCWWCPSAGTQQYLAFGGLSQVQSFEYIREVAVAAESFGFSDLLLPLSPRCIDPVVAAAYLGNFTKKLKLMLAVRPGHWNPVHFARAAGSLNLLFPGRIKINMIEGSPKEMKQENDLLPDNVRHHRRAEFIHIVRSLLKGLEITCSTVAYDLEQCRLPDALTSLSEPEWMISGHSSDSIALCARESATALFFGGSLKSLEPLLQAVAINEAEKQAGMAINIFARPTKAEAVTAANNYISRVSERHRANVRSFNERYPAIEGIPVEELAARNYWYDDILWYGLAAGRTHQRASLVGSYEEIAQEISKYSAAGISYFILTGAPNLEELRHIGQGVLPLING